MRPPRMTIVLMMMALGSAGAWLGVCAQDRRTPWPSSAAVPVEAMPVVHEQVKAPVDPSSPPTIRSATPIKIAASQEPDFPSPPRTLPSTLTTAAMVETPTAPSDVPAKLPAELPNQPHKTQAKTPVVESVESPKLPEAPPVVVTIPDPAKPEVVPFVQQPPATEAVEPLPLPRKVAAKPVEAKPKKGNPAETPPLPMFTEVPKVEPKVNDTTVPPLPMFTEVPRVEPKVDDKTVPPLPMFPDVPKVEPKVNDTTVPPLPMFPDVPKVAIPNAEKVAPPPAPVDVPKVAPAPLGIATPPLPMFTEVPKAAPREDKVAPPPVPSIPKVDAPANKNSLPPPTAGIDAKPLTPLKQNTVTAPIAAPEVAAPPAPLPGPKATPPIEIKTPAAPPRPPAFQIVRPRRVETLPSATEPVPSLIDVPRAAETPLASSTAQVTVEKRGPSELRQGVATSYQIIVRNRGASASGPITVVDEIPPQARQISGDPTPAQVGDKAIWTLPPLPAHSETVLKLSLQATSAGEFVGNTTVFVSAATATTKAKIQNNPEATTVASGPLGVLVRGPVGGAVGQQVVFEVQVTNRGKQMLTDLVLHAKLGDGLTHPSGSQIEADVGDLTPGASKTFKMPLTAVRSGRLTVEVKITAAGGAETHGQGAVLITGSGLSIQTAPTSRLLLDRDGDIRIDVTNLQAEGLRNVQIADTLPENIRFVAASDRGIYQGTTRTVQWLIDYLPPGETRSVTLRVQSSKPGQFAREVSASAESLPATRVQSVIQVEGYASLVLKVTPREQPLAVGKETVCEVRIQNLGNLPAAGVQLQVELPPGLTPGYVQGPSAYRVQGRTLIFEPIAKLPAQTQAVYHLGVAAGAAGDQRIRAQVLSDQDRAPVVREAPLQVYRE